MISIKDKKLCFSEIYGDGIYEYNEEEFVAHPFAGDENHITPLLTNIKSGDKYFVKKLNSKNNKVDKNAFVNFKNKILKPSDRKSILWPCDMVNLPDSLAKGTKLCVSKNYSEILERTEKNNCTQALLFPYEGYPTMINSYRKLADLGIQSWENPKIRDMVYNILKAFDNINRKGYIYGDIHFSRFFFRDDGTMYLDYSDLIDEISQKELDDFITEGVFSGSGGLNYFKERGYPFEFAEPAFVNGSKNFDFNSQNYSLGALIFYLFFGRYCYDGSALGEFPDNTPEEHYRKFSYYHKLPFIFDENDRRNSIGAFDEEMYTVDLWKGCPDMLKDIFVSVLSGNGNRKDNINPTAYTWIRCFNELGWISEEKE